MSVWVQFSVCGVVCVCVYVCEGVSVRAVCVVCVGCGCSVGVVWGEYVCGVCVCVCVWCVRCVWYVLSVDVVWCVYLSICLSVWCVCVCGVWYV